MTMYEHEKATRAAFEPTYDVEGYPADGVVSCDHQCGAPDDPKTDAEYRLAYEHWREHDHLYGCSHGR